MNNLKYGGFQYSTQNIGDEIQTLAAEQHLPPIDRRFDRDKLRLIEDDGNKYITILNGWFAHSPEDCFPPADSIIPIFISFHIAEENKNYFLSEPCINYFKKHEPIGCRDEGTMKMLKQKGVEAYFSGCLTTTFPKRNISPKNGKIFLVDVPIFVKQILSYQNIANVETVEHYTNNYGEAKLTIAQLLLDKYKNEASLIITNRVHCALPCAAMGIPVIFFGNPDDYRLQIVKKAGIPFYTTQLRLFNIPIDNILKKIPIVRFFLSKWLFYKYRNLDFKKITSYTKQLENIKADLIKNLKEGIDKKSNL